MSNLENTVRFSGEDMEEARMKEIMAKVFAALKEKGYNPINQISGYLLSGDPAYITSFNNARAIIQSVDRDEIVRLLVREYLK